MAAEIYLYDVTYDEPSIIRGQVLREDDTFSQAGLVDETGKERILTVVHGRVEVMSGRVILEQLADGREGLSITEAKHVETLQPGDTRLEELTGLDGEIQILHVRNIDEAELLPRGAYFFRHPSGLDAGMSFTFN